MPLNTPALKTNIVNILTGLSSNDNLTIEQSIEEFSNKLANAIETYVKGGTVTGTVTTVGSATTQTGPISSGQIE